MSRESTAERFGLARVKPSRDRCRINQIQQGSGSKISEGPLYIIHVYLIYLCIYPGPAGNPVNALFRLSMVA